MKETGLTLYCVCLDVQVLFSANAKDATNGPTRTQDLRPSVAFLNGFDVMTGRHDFNSLPSGTSLREAKVGIFEIGPLHNFLEKGFE